MFRTHLADGKGMLFPYSTPQEVTMWMRNTSAICCSIVCSGLSEVIGSWKIIETAPPRKTRKTRKKPTGGTR